MSYPDWFRAQVVQAVARHGLSYAKASRLYNVTDETVKTWVQAASDVPVGLDRMEALEHRVARIERQLALDEEVDDGSRDGSRRPFPVGRGNGHGEWEATARVTTPAPDVGRMSRS